MYAITTTSYQFFSVELLLTQPSQSGKVLWHSDAYAVCLSAPQLAVDPEHPHTRGANDPEVSN